jgi:hypothetical protein
MSGKAFVALASPLLSECSPSFPRWLGVTAATLSSRAGMFSRATWSGSIRFTTPRFSAILYGRENTVLSKGRIAFGAS